MVDNLTPRQRSEVMSAVKGKNTAPETLVRKALHSLGYRFRLHRNDLPGKPDIVLPKHHLCIFVHGCFWHQHPGCSRSARPVTNTDFWNAKLDGNVARDKRDIEGLQELGWRVCIVWECETKKPAQLTEAISRCLEGVESRATSVR